MPLPRLVTLVSIAVVTGPSTCRRLESTPTSIDGALTESAWNSAALLTGFSQYQPVDGRAAEDSTHVLVWYAPAGIYFGVRAFESHGTVNPTLSDRDRIEADDYVQILIDTFNDRRQALVFGVNPLGIQSDGIQSEGQQHSRTALVTADLTRDFVYRSAGRVTASSYQVEVHIPFKSISYQSARAQDWGINILRKVRHSGYLDSWAPVRRRALPFWHSRGHSSTSPTCSAASWWTSIR